MPLTVQQQWNSAKDGMIFRLRSFFAGFVRAFALEVCEERSDIKAEIIEYTIDHEICGVRVREEIGRELYYMITKTEE